MKVPATDENMRRAVMTSYLEQKVLRIERGWLWLVDYDEETDVNNPIMQHFDFEHLPDFLQDVSKPLCVLAQQMNQDLPDGPEKSAGLRKLLEAKDCFVRAGLD